MAYLVLLLCSAYAVIDVFGAWGAVRRNRWVATGFMVAGSLLVVGGIAYIFDAAFGFAVLVAGAVGSSLATLASARWVVGRLTWLEHLVRAVGGAALIALAWFAGPG